MTARPRADRGGRLAIGLLAFGAFAVGTGLFALNGVLDQAAHDLRSTPAVVGQAVTVFAATYAVGAPLLAALGSRLPVKTVLVGALVVLVAGNLLTAAAPDPALLLASRVVAAVGAAAYTPAALAVAAALAGPQRSGAALAVVQAGLNGALAVGVPIGVGVAALSTWRSALLVVGVLGAAAALAIALAVRDLPPAPAVRPLDAVRLLRSGSLVGVLAVTVLAVASGISAYTYVSGVFGATVAATGGLLLVLLAAYGVGAFAGTLLAGPAVDRVGARPVLLGALVLQAVVLAAVPLAHLLAPALVLAVLWGAAATASTPPQQVRMIGFAPASPAVAVSLNSSGIYVGQGLGAALGGVALTAGLSAGALPFLASALAVGALIVGVLQRGDRPARSTPPRRTPR